MNDGKLRQAIDSLDESEQRSFKKFLLSPFFNKREDVRLLYDYLTKKNVRKYPFEYHAISKYIYPERKMDEQKVRLAMTYLMRLVEEFMVQVEMEESQIERQRILTRAFRKRNLIKHFNQSYRKTQEAIDESPLDNLYLQLEKNWMTLEQYYAIKEHVRNQEMNLQLLTDSMDAFYVGSKLHQACILKTHEKFREHSYDYGMLDIILGFLERESGKGLMDKPCVALYYYGYQTLTGDNPRESFEKLKTGLQLYAAQFDKTEQRELYFIAINYGIQQLNKGDASFVMELYQLYQISLERGLLVENGIISQFVFKNIIALGFRLEEHDWTEGFIKDYAQYLDKEEEENNLNYNLAKFYFERKQYKPTLQLLQKVKYKDLLPNLTARVLVLKTFYEMDEWEILENQLRNFSKMVKRQRGMGYHKSNFLNLIKYFLKIIHMNPYDKEETQKLRNEISLVQTLPEKSWLLSKIQS